MFQPHKLWQDPTWFLKDIDLDQSQFEFYPTSREALSDAPFLDERFFGNNGSISRNLAFRDLSAMPEAAPEGCFLFHTAFCCSTLLASVLDLPGKVLALKEPGVVMKLANLNRRAGQANSTQMEQLNQLTWKLLFRRFQPEEQLLLKPTNAANNLLPSAVQSGARVLLLYSDLASFLISVIKKGEACRYFVRHLLNILRLDRPDIDAWPDRQRMLLTDLQVAALVWSIQIDMFQHILNTTPEQQVCSLKVDEFLAEPAEILQALNGFFPLNYSPEELARMEDNPRFTQHAKFANQDYDASVRRKERVQIEAQYAEEISTTLDWARRLRNDQLPDVLPRALNTTP